MKQEDRCWHFVMSSFSRTYGVNRVMSEQKFHVVALQWCDDHNYVCDVHSRAILGWGSFTRWQATALPSGEAITHQDGR